MTLREYMAANNLKDEDVAYVANFFYRNNDGKATRFSDIAGLKDVIKLIYKNVIYP